MPRRSSQSERSGFAVVIVLALLTVTLALSYSMMRVQANTNEIQRNMSRQANARQAAISGISAGLREMYGSNWGGIGSTLSMNLGNNHSYQVRYDTGDPWLAEDAPDYAEFPFRVTVTSTGYALDSINSTVKSQYTIRAVVQLVRKKLQANPSQWTAAAGYTLYSFGTKDNYLEAPWQVHGQVLINGELHLCEDWQVTNRPFCGYIDEIAIYDRVLSGYEIYSIASRGNSSASTLSSTLNRPGIRHWWRFNEADYTSTTAFDSVGGRHGKYKGGVYPGIDIGGDNKVVLVDGVSGRIELGDFDLPDHSNFTIAAWLRPTNIDGDNEEGRIISRASGTSAQDHWWMLGAKRSGLNSYPWTRLKTTSNFYDKSPNKGSFSTQDWNFVVLTFEADENELKLYNNGYERDDWTAYGTAASSSNLLTWIGDNPPGAARSRLLEDFTRLAIDGGGNYRPLSGSITLSNETNPLSTALTLYRQLGCSVRLTSPDAGSHSNTTVSGSTYQLYPGGQAYSLEEVPGSIENTSLLPDVVTNPLGLYRSNGSLNIRDNVSIKGTLICQPNSGKLKLRGSSFSVQALPLPPLVNDDTAYQLPVLIAGDDFEIDSNAQASIQGAVVAFGEFEADDGDSESYFQIDGPVFAENVDLQACDSWQSTAAYSATHQQNFLNIKGQTTTENFAQWLNESTSGKLTDRFRIALPENPPTYQWLDLSQPIYQVGDDDTGLVWELIRWKDNGGV
ncbi:hypothetical protein DTL42_19875 [Bremerella cremea]|uniref:LamG-like jellyroll fold domain-containing protein n=1 Tax=Bremerella cremea TaxID=1031537 RepID=A0A368KQ76_9BACT|nr:LamG-like jellyroll fold domain-containing protein [Bremerella cremea]RCS42090.1 hypothetical protein DTL42_19875 [Bremerella cremea]